MGNRQMHQEVQKPRAPLVPCVCALRGVVCIACMYSPIPYTCVLNDL